MEQTIKKLREKLIPLYDKGESEAIIRLIFHHLKGWNLTDILIHKKEVLSDYIKSEIDEILKRLLRYEPVQYITGEARFHGMDLIIKPGVLIPRQETEELVDLIIDDNKHKRDLKVLDICTGSGCIAIALARNLPFSEVSAVDISPEAIEVTGLNKKKLKTYIKVINKDIFEWIPSETFDVIVSNPPYVLDKEAISMEKNVLDYEPHEAIFVRDEKPLVFYERIADLGKTALNEEGRLYFEVNPLMVNELKTLLLGKGYKDINIVKDSSAKDRFIYCTK